MATNALASPRFIARTSQQASARILDGRCSRLDFPADLVPAAALLSRALAGGPPRVSRRAGHIRSSPGLFAHPRDHGSRTVVNSIFGVAFAIVLVRQPIPGQGLRMDWWICPSRFACDRRLMLIVLYGPRACSASGSSRSESGSFMPFWHGDRLPVRHHAVRVREVVPLLRELATNRSRPLTRLARVAQPHSGG